MAALYRAFSKCGSSLSVPRWRFWKQLRRKSVHAHLGRSYAGHCNSFGGQTSQQVRQGFSLGFIPVNPVLLETPRGSPPSCALCSFSPHHPPPSPSSRGGLLSLPKRFFTCFHNGSTASSLEPKGEWSKRHSRGDCLYHLIIYNHRLGSFIRETVGHSEYRLGCESAAPPPAFPMRIFFLLFLVQMVTDFCVL